MNHPSRRPALRLHARDILREMLRTLWYLPAILAGLLVLFILPTITALTLGYGDVVPTSTWGRLDAILLGLVGMIFTGLIVAAAVRGVQEAARQASLES
jgi:voltage-gated potassium channel